MQKDTAGIRHDVSPSIKITPYKKPEKMVLKLKLKSLLHPSSSAAAALPWFTSFPCLFVPGYMPVWPPCHVYKQTCPYLGSSSDL